MMFLDTLVKETKQLSKDKGFLLIAFLQPIIFIVMFGSSFENGDINHLDTIVIDEDLSIYSSYVFDAINESEYYDIMEYNGTFAEAREMMNNGDVRAIFRILPGFGSNIDSSESGEIDVVVDSSNFLVYVAVMGARSEVIGDTLQNISSDLLGDLEDEKVEGQEKVDEIKEDLDDVQNKSDDLTEKFEEIRDDLEDLTLEKFNEDIEDLEDGLDDLEDGMRSIKSNLSSVGELVASIQVVGEEDIAKRDMVIAALLGLEEGMSEMRDANDDIQDEVQDIDAIDVDISESIEELEAIFENLNESFISVKDKSNDVDFDLEGLQADFLVEPVVMNTEEIYGDINYFDYLGAGVLSLIVFFICILAPALNVIGEKESNTLYRISTTPVSTVSVFLGKFLLFLLFGFVEMAYTLLLAIVLYDLRITGSIFDVIGILTLLACASISIGLFISSKVSTMQQALVIVPVLVIPSFLISNSFFPPDIMPEFMDKLSMITPMTFSNHALNSVMIKGFEVSFVWTDILALVLFAVVPLVLFIWSYRRIRY